MLKLMCDAYDRSRFNLCLVPTSCLFLVWVTLQSWWWRQYVPPKRQCNFIRLHSVTSQKTVFFKVTTLRMLTPKWFLCIHIFRIVHRITWTITPFPKYVSNYIRGVYAKPVLGNVPVNPARRFLFSRTCYWSNRLYERVLGKFNVSHRFSLLNDSLWPEKVVNQMKVSKIQLQQVSAQWKSLSTQQPESSPHCVSPLCRGT